MKERFNENIRDIEIFMLAQFIDVIEIISKYKNIEEVKNDIDKRIKLYLEEIKRITKTKDFLSINLNDEEIDSTINKCREIYSESGEYKKILEKANKKFTSLTRKIKYKDKVELEEMRNLISQINNYDIHLSYKIGLVEGMKIKNKCT